MATALLRSKRNASVGGRHLRLSLSSPLFSSPSSLLPSSATATATATKWQAHQPRLFTQNHPLLLLTSTATPIRPQLPYLSQSSRHSPSALHRARGPAFQGQLARLLSTETRQYVREQVWLATKWSALGWGMLFLLGMAWYGWQQELIEREHTSPAEWSYFTRTAFRHAYARLDPEFDGTGIIDWGAVGSEFRHALERLEDASIDGQGLLPVGSDGTETVDGVDHLDPLSTLGVAQTRYDVGAKSYPWRAGYFEVVMGCARAAEYLDDMVRDKKRKLVFPKNVVIGPSNPDPRPTPPGAPSAPREEDCDRPYMPPETFYMKVLTGAGFATRQRVQAALAYANWLEYKGLQESAEETYKWALDIAASALPQPQEAVDTRTGIIKVQENAYSQPSANVLKAATALATHYARAGNITSALPVYLSVLRARRSAPLDPAAVINSRLSPSAKPSVHSGTDYGRVYSILSSIIRSSEYPAEPPSGDEAFFRSVPADRDCDDAEVMLYIGEILFATSGAGAREDEGLGWTRQAVEIAERALLDKSSDLSRRETAVCKSCLDTGLANWGAMVQHLIQNELQTKAHQSPVKKRGWFSFWGSEVQENQESTRSKWLDEAAAVEHMRMKLAREGISERMAALGGTAPGSVWIG